MLEAAHRIGGSRIGDARNDDAIVSSAYRQASGRLVMNTEWGPQNGGDLTSRANLMRIMREECEAAAIPWTVWEDPNNLPLYDSATGQWQEALVSTLFE